MLSVAVQQSGYKILFGEIRLTVFLYVIDIKMFQTSITTYVKTYHDGDYLTVGHGQLAITDRKSVV